MSGVAAIVLAAGASTRFRAACPGAASKLVADLDGLPLVRHAALAALASRARPVVVVTGHAETAVRDALADLDLGFAHNANFASGLAASLRVGLDALPADVSGVVVLLGDMPRVRAALVDRLIEAHEARPDAEAIVPVHAGRRGNPVLLGRALFAAAGRLAGDEGARRLLDRAVVREVEVAEGAAWLDVDDPETLRRIASC